VGAEREFAGARRPSNFSAFEIEDFRERPRTLVSLGGYSAGVLAFEGPDGVEPLTGAFVDGDFFPTIGQPAAAGRLLGPADDLSPMTVVSHRLAQRLFGGSPQAVGTTLALSGHAYTVVGVAAPDFRLPQARTDVWTPMGLARQGDLAPWLNWPRGGGVSFVARLRPGATVEEALGDLEELSRQLALERPDVARGRVPTVTPVAESVAGAVRPALRLLFGAVGLVLLVASANVANLLLARHASRERDIAVRLALGASQGRLITHAMAECVILGVGGGVGGLLLAAGAVRALVWLEPIQLPRLDAIHVDGPVLGFALAVTAAATLAAGLVPAIRASRRDAASSLALGVAARIAGSARAGRLRSALVVAQLGAAALLLVGSSLLARSFVRLLHTDTGARTDGVIVARLDFSLGRQLSEPQEHALAAALVERVKSIPGVRFAALGAALPPNGRMAGVTLRDLPTARGLVPEYAVNAAPITADFFSTLGIPLLKGRLFDDGDDADHPPVAIVSVDAARDLFEGDPLGRTLPLPTRKGGSLAATVVGVVGNVKYEGLAKPAVPTVYVPFAQLPWSTAFLAARTAGEPKAFAPELRRAISEVDRRSGIAGIETIEEIRSREAAPPGFRTAVLGAIAALAAALAAIGLAGVVGYTVSRRTAEIGVRMALGACRGDVLFMVLREGLLLGAIGGASGLAAALALTRVLGAFVYGITATDPASFVSAAAVLLLLVLLASYLPARRAARVDPTLALRAE
jgi:predicted permease